MPNYIYLCGQCEHEFEAYQSIRRTYKVRCPKCNSTAKKTFKGAPTILKNGRKGAEIEQARLELKEKEKASSQEGADHSYYDDEGNYIESETVKMKR